MGTRSCDIVSPVTVSTANQSTEPSYSTLSTTCQNFTNQKQTPKESVSKNKFNNSERSLSSQPLDWKALAKEMKMKEFSKSKHKSETEESDDERRPHVIKAVNVWKARKREEARLNRRYKILCNKFNRS